MTLGFVIAGNPTGGSKLSLQERGYSENGVLFSFWVQGITENKLMDLSYSR